MILRIGPTKPLSVPLAGVRLAVIGKGVRRAPLGSEFPDCPGHTLFDLLVQNPNSMFRGSPRGPVDLRGRDERHRDG